MTDELTRLVATCDTTLAGQRDRALLLLGYAGALRRSELVAIEREHVQLTHDGLRLLIPRAKGDQTGKGVSIGLPRAGTPERCPVRTLEIWLEASGCRYGPVFRGIDHRGVISNRGLHPPTQHMATLREGIEQVASAISAVVQGSFIELEHPRRPLLRRPPPDQSR